MRIRIFVAISTVVLTCSGTTAAPTNPEIPNLIKNGGFEVEGRTTGVPEHFLTAPQYRLTEEETDTGKRAVRFRSDGPAKWRYLSQNVSVAPNHRYTLSIRALNRDVQDLWLVWSEKPGIGLWRRERAQIRTCKEWTTYDVSFTTGEDCEISVGIGVTGSHQGPATAYVDGLHLGDYVPKPISDGIQPSGAGFQPRSIQRLRSRPALGETVSLNPPAFKWTDQGYDLYSVQWCNDPAFAAPEEISSIEMRLYTPDHSLEPGVWYWRHAGHSAGIATLWSAPKKFIIPENTPRLPVPSEQSLLARIPRTHPRAFFTGELLEAARQHAAGPGKAEFESIRKGVERKLKTPLPDDPKQVDRSDWSPEQVKKYLSVHQTAAAVCSRAISASFAYLISGRQALGEEAKRCALHVAAWDPAGGTDVRYSDYAAFYTILALAFPYDWANDRFTPEERERVEKAIRTRGNMMYQCFQKSAGIDVRPYHSHGWLNVRKVCIAAVATIHEVPEAAKWLHWAAQLHVGLFPAWGGDDGAWAQGVAYYDGSYTLEANWFAELLKNAAGLNLYDKPWYRNTPNFLLYCCPPYGLACEFGDGSPGKKPSGNFRASMRNLAAQQDNPYALWYSRSGRAKWGGWAGFLNFLWARPPSMIPKPPLDLPLSKWFRDVDWAVMHTDLSGANDVMFAMKASSYGSYNHSHCDQNSFTLSARGQRLAIDSGYYDYYGSEHHKQWTTQTVAHNAILVDGVGQPRSLAAGGFIRDHVGGTRLAYAAGDASPAYAGRISRWIRHTLFIRPGCIIICDDLAADGEHHYTWLLHALQQMTVNQERQTVTISSGGVSMEARFLYPTGLSFEQTDEFLVPSSKPQPKQWHLSVKPAEKSRSLQFLTALIVRPEDEAQPVTVVKQDVRGGLGPMVHHGSSRTSCAFRLGDAPHPITNGLLHTDGAAASVTVDADNNPAAAMLSLGTELGFDGMKLVRTDLVSSVSLDTFPMGAWITVHSKAPQQIHISLPRKPRQVLLNNRAIRTSWKANRRLSPRDRSGIVSLHCPAGDASVQCRFARKRDSLPPLLTVLDCKGQTLSEAPMEIIHAWSRGTTAALGCARNVSTGYCRVRIEPTIHASSGISVRVGPEIMNLNEGTAEILVSSEPDVEILAANPGAMPVKRIILQSAGPPVAAGTDVRTCLNSSDRILVEAETFSEGSTKLAVRDSKYVGVSGSIVHGWSGFRTWIAWDVTTTHEGEHEVILRGTSDFERTLADFTVDGKVPGPACRQILYSNTGGWGYSDDDWQSFILCRTDSKPFRLRLSAGQHRIKMTCIEGGMNLDYLMLVPAPAD